MQELVKHTMTDEMEYTELIKFLLELTFGTWLNKCSKFVTNNKSNVQLPWNRSPPPLFVKYLFGRVFPKPVSPKMWL